MPILSYRMQKIHLFVSRMLEKNACSKYTTMFTNSHSQCNRSVSSSGVLIENVQSTSYTQYIDPGLRPTRRTIHKECVFSLLPVSYSNTGGGYRRGTSGRGACRPLLAMGALSIFGLFKKEEINQTVLKINQARRAHEELHFEEAEQLYHEGLYRLIEDRKSMGMDEKEFLEKRTVIINGLANLALISGRVREAEELFKDCMKGMLLCGKEQTDNAMVEMSLKLSNVYAQQTRYAEAMAGYRFCVKTQEKKVMEKDAGVQVDNDTLALYGLSLDNYARFLISRNEFAEAELCLKKALKVSEDLSDLGEDIVQTSLIILNNLATLFSRRQDFKSAEVYLEKVVQLAEAAKWPELAAFYCNLGSVYIRMGRFEEALKFCQRSKNLAKKSKDPHVESMAHSCLEELEIQKNKQKS